MARQAVPLVTVPDRTTDLTDFSETPANDGETPVWNAGLGKYVPGTPGGGSDPWISGESAGTAITLPNNTTDGDAILAEVDLPDGAVAVGATILWRALAKVVDSPESAGVGFRISLRDSSDVTVWTLDTSNYFGRDTDDLCMLTGSVNIMALSALGRGVVRTDELWIAGSNTGSPANALDIAPGAISSAAKLVLSGRSGDAAVTAEALSFAIQVIDPLS